MEQEMTYPESATIVRAAIKTLSSGNLGLAEKLKKHPSLISRYARGSVRPKAEVLLECIEICKESQSPPVEVDRDHTHLDFVKSYVDSLDESKDQKIIEVLYDMLNLVQQLSSPLSKGR